MAPDNKSAICVDRIGEVKGTEKIIPAMKVNVHFRHASAAINTNYMKYLHNLTGLVNSTPLFQWAAGEVLFLGASGSDGSNNEATLRYSFAMSANLSGATIGGIAGIAKKGWEFLWIKYHDAVSESQGASQALAIYVERIYDTADLAGMLGFG